MNNYKRLSSDEREEISRMLAQNCSLNNIAKSLSRYTSTISREVKLGSCNKYTYRAGKAQRRASRNASKRKVDKRILNDHLKLKRYIDEAVALHWARNGQWLTARLADLCLVEESAEPILRLISGGETLVLDETDGAETISTATDLFAFIDPDFKNWGADEASKPTAKMPVAVYELSRDAIFARMFGSADNFDRLCLAQSQIPGFVRKYRNWLQPDGYATFFPFRSKGNRFVADVDRVGHGKLYTFVDWFGYDRVWGAGFRYRVVLPQL